MDDKTSQQTITLSETQIYDCNERQFLKSSAHKVKKRSISRKFDINFIMKSDIYNNVNYALQGGNILTKMTAYNLKTLSLVGAFQDKLDRLMQKYSLVNPAAIVEQTYNTTLAFNLENFSFVYVDNFKNIFLPVIRLDFKVHEFSMKQLGISAELSASVEIRGNYNNSRTAKWEPFLETLHLDMILKKDIERTKLHMAGGLENTAEGLYLNFSEELLEIILHSINNANTVIEAQQPEEIGDEEEEMIIYDSQFLIRNKTGYDIFIQTIGDRKGKKTRVKNMSDKFVNFIINDEFSTKDVTTRDVILTFGPEIHQSNLCLH